MCRICTLRKILSCLVRDDVRQRGGNKHADRSIDLRAPFGPERRDERCQRSADRSGTGLVETCEHCLAFRSLQRLFSSVALGSSLQL